MDSGYYAACTALVARTQALDTVANNIANASTVGFRSERNIFSSVLADAGDANTSPISPVINSYGILSGTMVDTTQGAFEKTGNDLDLGIEGKGYFAVQTANGTMYTRDGAFEVSSKGQMVTSAGDAVLGDKGPILLPPGKIVISTDGTMSSDGAVVGKVKLVEFRAGTELSNAGNSLYAAPADAKPVVASESSIRQGSLESSNVNAVSSMIQLVEAQRSAEMMQRALSMFNSEIDKTASQDLPKVG
jgi:flagellar basal-body rod protein FlgF/flagellar basal-body rod protein FlgG